MKNKNKIISILMCLSLALVPGCSQDNGGEPAATPADAFAAGNADSIGTTTTAAAEENPAGAVSDETAAEVTEAAETASGELFAYYDLLKEEYEKCGRLYYIDYAPVDYRNYHIKRVNEKILNLNEAIDGATLYEYDLEKKESKDITFTLSDPVGYYQFFYDDKNGYIYALGNSTISKYDNSGKLLNQLEWDGYLYQDGKCTVKLFSDGTFLTQEEGKHNLYSSDWTTKTEVPVIQAEAGHGLKKDVDFSNCYFVTKYNNKVYAYVSGDRYASGDKSEGFYCLNTDTMTWEAVKSGLSEMTRDSGYRWSNNFIPDIYTIGRYLLITGSYANQQDKTSKIYDMETDTVIATVSNLGIVDYMGKDYDLILDRGVLTKNKYPSDGSEPVIETVIDTGDTSLKTNYSTMKDMLIPINEQYYVFEDEYGIFLREYGKGEEGEITVLIFEQQ